MGTTDSEILRLTKLGKSKEKDADFEDAKKYYLDAASLAIKESKKPQDKIKEESYNRIAKNLIEMAKEVDKLISSKTTSEKGNQTMKATKIITKDPLKEKIKLEEIFAKYQFTDKKEEISIPLGNSEQGDLVSWIPGNEMNGIFMINGGSGSGKTEAIRSLITELINFGYPCLILDVHGDIEVDVPTLSLDYSGSYGINPMELLSKSINEGGPIPQVNQLTQLLNDAVEGGFTPIQENHLRSILLFAYKINGIFQEEYITWNNEAPNFNYVFDLLRTPKKTLGSKLYNEFCEEVTNVNSTTTNSIINKTIQIFEHPAFNSRNYIPIEKCFQLPIRINLKPLRTLPLQFLAVEIILKQLFSKSLDIGHYKENVDIEKFRIFIIIDEMKILSNMSGKKDDPYNIINRLVTESRKFGIGLIMASQIIEHFSKETRANCATKLTLRPMDKDQIKQNAKELGIAEEKIKELNLPGEGYIVSTSNPEPMKLRLFPNKDRPYLTKKFD